MLAPKSAFFVFNSNDTRRLAANPSLLIGIDCVISGVPGVPLDALGDRIRHVTLEEALLAFQISRRDISTLASAYCLALLDKEVMTQVLKVLDKGADESVRVALLNHAGFLTHNAFSFELLFDAMVRKGLSRVRAFRGHGRYRLVERLDIRTLLQGDLGFWPHLEHLCQDGGVKLTGIGLGDRLAPAKNALRDLLLLGYKGKTLLQRSLRAGKPPQVDAYDAAVVVRARTEVIAAEPVLRERAKRGYHDILLVDDLIKTPDGTSAASAGSHDWLPLSSYATPIEVACTFLRCIILRGTAARRGLLLRPNRVAGVGFLGCKDVAQQVLYTTLASVPELLIHRLQLNRALEQLSPSALVSFDQVDRWGAMQGELARQRGIHSVMVQNTAIDDMVYPWPLAMDHLVVGYEHLREVFIKSGANPDSVHSFGLPLHDDVLQAGDKRLQELCHRAVQQGLPLRVLIATQPFIEEFDYNNALLADFEAAIRCLDFDVEWILKPHPREAKGKYAVTLDTLIARGHNVKLFEGPFETALSESDIVLSRNSTGLEFAALGGVPGISYLNRFPADFIEELDYLKSPVTAKSFDIAGLRALIEGYAPDNRLENIRRYAEKRSLYLNESFPGRGHATERVVDLIENGANLC